MIYQNFRNEFIDQVYFASNQVYAWYPDFDKNNLRRWVNKKYLVKLRNGYYTFRELLDTPNINLYLANRIYKPSYVSLHSALSFYGLIPEAVAHITSVSTLKTTVFGNDLGSFSYQKVKSKVFMGFVHLPFLRGKEILAASPEKALLDLLYLFPYYNTEKEMYDLRLDADILHETVDSERMNKLLKGYGNKALDRRIDMLYKCYKL